MKKIIAFIVIFLSMVSSQVALADSAVVNTVSSSLYVRQSPSVSSHIIGTLSKNSKISTLGKIGNFYRINYKGRNGYVVASFIKLVKPVVASLKIPVLMYHRVVTYHKIKDSLGIQQKTFRAHMNYLKTHGYNTISMDQLYNYISKNTPLPKKPVVITFDDGYVSNYTLAYPILKANKQKATVFMIASFIDKNKGFLTSKELKIMDANNFRVENHTYNHDKLGTLSYKNQLTTINKTKQILQKILGRQEVYIGYPYGSYNSNTKKACQKKDTKWDLVRIMDLLQEKIIYMQFIEYL